LQLSFGVRPHPSSQALMKRAFVRLPRLLQLFVAASLGCATPSAPGPQRDDSPVQTDAVVYRLRRIQGAYEATARATYVNRTGSIVYYTRCLPTDDGPIFGYRRTGPDSARSLFSDTGWACVGGVPPGALRPGDSVTVAVRLGAFDQPRMTPPLRPEEIVGQMRIWLDLCARNGTRTDDCLPLPIAQKQSNAFDVRY
jgi:hypothetical protein